MQDHAHTVTTLGIDSTRWVDMIDWCIDRLGEEHRVRLLDFRGTHALDPQNWAVFPWFIQKDMNVIWHFGSQQVAMEFALAWC